MSKPLNAITAAHLIASNLYDAKILPKLEEYVLHQVAAGAFDFDANRHVLKLYQASPQLLKLAIVCKILAMALMALPEAHFLSCTYLVPETAHDTEPIKSLLVLADLLETAQFAKFWKAREEKQSQAAVDGVSGFDDAIRGFIVTTFAVTHKTVSSEILKTALNLSDNKALESFVVKAKGTMGENGATVAFAVPESGSAPKTAEGAIPIEHVSRLLAVFSA